MILHRTVLRSGDYSTLTVHVEPWGERHTIDPGCEIEIIFYGPQRGKAEVVVSENELMIYGWEGTDVFVLRNNMCVSQPSLELILRVISNSAGIETSPVAEFPPPEMLEYAQAMLDSAPFWDKEGREAALFAISKLSEEVCRVASESVAVEFCNHVLHSRGIFIPTLTVANTDFLEALRKGDAVPYIIEAETAAVESLTG